MFKILDLPSDGAPIERAGEDFVAPPPPRTVRWVDLEQPDAQALAVLRERFQLDNLAIEDCASYGLTSKIDDYDRYLFVVVHAFTADPDDPLEIRIHEIHAFLAESYLITVHDNPITAHDTVWDRARTDRHVLERGPSWVLYLNVDAMIEATVPLVERLTADLDLIERRIIEEGGATDLAPVFRIRRTTVAMRRVIRPLRDVLNILHRRGDPRIAPRAALHLRDAADHVVRLADMIEELREVCGNVLAAYQALQAAHTNEVVKKLTIFSAVFLPLSFIVGFWGQNFTDLPYDSPIWLAIMLTSLVVVPAGLMEWFRRNVL